MANEKQVLCVETGRVYGSLRLAGERLGISPQNISHALGGKCNTAGGYHWEYIHLEKTEPVKQPKPVQKDTRKMSIYEVQEEARRRTEKTGRYTDYADIQKEETVRLIREGKLCPTKRRK